MYNSQLEPTKKEAGVLVISQGLSQPVEAIVGLCTRHEV